jgi:hypothetical protein
MKRLTFHDQRVADLAADDEQDDLVVDHIIQHAQVADPQFEPGEGVRSQCLDGSRQLRGPIT